MPSRCCHREIHSSGMAQAFLMSSQLKRCVGEYCNACVHLLKIQVLHLLFLIVTMLFAVIRAKQVCRMLNCELLVSMLSEQWSVNLLSVLSEHWPVNFAVHVVRMLPSELTVHVVRMLTCELLLSVLSGHWPVNCYCPCCQNIDLWTSAVIICWPVNFYCPCCQNSDLWMFTVHVVRTQTLTAAWCRCCVSRHTSSTTVMPCCWMRGCHSTTSTSSTSSPSSSPWYEGTFVTTLPHHLHTPTYHSRTHAPTHTCTLSHTHLLIRWIRKPFVLRI